MVDWWISLVGATVPAALVAGQAIRMKNRRAEEQRLNTLRGREKSSDDIFVCERVCTSKRMLNKVGAFSIVSLFVVFLNSMLVLMRVPEPFV